MICLIAERVSTALLLSTASMRRAMVPRYSLEKVNVHSFMYTHT